jgi:hypothetical protein
VNTNIAFIVAQALTQQMVRYNKRMKTDVPLQCPFGSLLTTRPVAYALRWATMGGQDEVIVAN